MPIRTRAMRSVAWCGLVLRCDSATKRAKAGVMPGTRHRILHPWGRLQCASISSASRGPAARRGTCATVQKCGGRHNPSNGCGHSRLGRGADRQPDARRVYPIPPAGQDAPAVPVRRPAAPVRHRVAVAPSASDDLALYMTIINTCSTSTHLIACCRHTGLVDIDGYDIFGRQVRRRGASAALTHCMAAQEGCAGRISVPQLRHVPPGAAVCAAPREVHGRRPRCQVCALRAVRLLHAPPHTSNYAHSSINHSNLPF